MTASRQAVHKHRTCPRSSELQICFAGDAEASGTWHQNTGFFWSGSDEGPQLPQRPNFLHHLPCRTARQITHYPECRSASTLGPCGTLHKHRAATMQCSAGVTTSIIIHGVTILPAQGAPETDGRESRRVPSGIVPTRGPEVTRGARQPRPGSQSPVSVARGPQTRPRTRTHRSACPAA